MLTTTGRLVNDRETHIYFASVRDCRSCQLKMQCCPRAPFRRVPRSIYEDAREVARSFAKTEAFERSRHDRKRVEMLFAHLKRILTAWSSAIARTARCPVRVRLRGNRTKPPQARKANYSTTAGRILLCVGSKDLRVTSATPRMERDHGRALKNGGNPLHIVIAEFCNKICQKQTSFSTMATCAFCHNGKSRPASPSSSRELPPMCCETPHMLGALSRLYWAPGYIARRPVVSPFLRS